MTIQQVIDLAKNGELKNLAVKDDTEAVIGFINLGLIELYKRFTLVTKEQVIELLDSQEIYSLPTDCLSIVAAYGEVDENSGKVVDVLPINVEDNPLSINTINWKEVQIPVHIAGSYISLIYVAAPAYLTIADVDSTLELPVQLLEALLHYIGYRAHGSVNGSIQAENNTHYQRFELSCNRVVELGMLTSDDLDMNVKFGMRGFA